MQAITLGTVLWYGLAAEIADDALPDGIELAPVDTFAKPLQLHGVPLLCVWE